MPEGRVATTQTEEEPDGRDLHGQRVPALCLSLECERPLVAPELHLLQRVDAVQIGRGPDERRAERRTEGGERILALELPDRWMSSAHAVLRRVLGRWLVEDAGSKNGTFVNGFPVERAELSDGDVLELGHSFFVFRAVSPMAADEAQKAAASLEKQGLSTLRAGYAEDLRALERLAPAAVSVVLRGETGTGKEVVARALHSLSGRTGAFVAVNCGALPAALIESELFGYRKGAFSGALEDRPGLVRSADRGTLFLDEIGDLPLALQTSLLRVLSESEVLPLGAVKAIPVDLRVVAATHRDLDAMVAASDFRADLLARVSGFTLVLPPLRERREDLGLLIAALLRKLLGERASRVSFALPAARALFMHAWPLNVRQLERALGVAAALATEGRIELEHLPPSPPAPAAAPDLPGRQLTEAEEQLRKRVVELLTLHNGNVTAVAREMDKARMQVQRWIKRFGIDANSFRK